MNTSTDTNVVDQLQARIHGQVVEPSAAAYYEARRVWNGNIDRRPALIVQCTDAADVQAAVRLAREHGLPASVRGGGHSFSARRSPTASGFTQRSRWPDTSPLLSPRLTHGRERRLIAEDAGA